MTVLLKSQIQSPILPSETCDVPELGGEIIVRGLLLRDRLALAVSGSDNKFSNLSAMLACTVVDAESKAIFTQDQWEEFGSAHFEAALKLFGIAQKLSGMGSDGSEKKNSES